MTAAPSTSAEPDGAPRIASLDILRGIAILGILFMNINDMGASIWSSYGEVWRIGWTRADQAAWWLREVIADGTARGMLELLFGAGMVILTGRAATRADEWTVVRGYYVRNLVLLAFGLIHLFVLLWTGDILHTYALAAMIAVLFRGLPARQLLLFGLSLTAFQLVSGGYGYYQSTAVRAAAADVKARHGAQPLSVADRQVVADAAAQASARSRRAREEQAATLAENAARSGSFTDWAQSLWGATLFAEAKGLELDYVWEAVSAMLIGAALYRWGIIQGARSPRFYTGLMLCGYALAVPLRIWSAAQAVRFDGAPCIDWATYELARLAMTLGHLGLVHVVLVRAGGRRVLAPFAAAGRTALSIYVLQTLIGLWLLYPPFALGLYGKQGWASLMATALAIDVGLLLLANWWVRRFTIAPVEWAWRSLAEGRRLPFGQVPRPGAALPA